MTISIIGIDCATQANKVGLARGYPDGDSLIIDRLAKPGPGQTVADGVSEWVSKDRQTLFAIDAPLGWPAELGQSLNGHLAGGRIPVQPNTLFRRETDRFVKRATGKQSLDVGADRIARTAHAALHYLDGIRTLLNQPVPLAWQPGVVFHTVLQITGDIWSESLTGERIGAVT